MVAKYWVTRLGEGGKYIEYAKKGDYIAIGWELGDLKWLADYKGDWNKAWQKLSNIYKETYSGTSVSVGIGTGQVWNFAREMQEQDIVLVPDLSEGQFLVAKIIGHYEYKERGKWGDACPYPNRRKVEWQPAISSQDVSQKLRNSFYSWLTVFSIDHHAEELTRILSGEKTPTRKVEVTGKELYLAVVNKLLELNPQEFEHFMAHILSTIGFQAAVTQYVGDKGVDVIGTLSAEGMAEITLRLQVKRVTWSIGNDEVLKIRGALAGDEHGAIVTTSKFTKQAREEAESQGKKKIALIDGKALVDLILTHYDELDDSYKTILGLHKKEILIVDQFSVMAKS